MSLTREHIIAGVRDGCWSHSSGQDILDLWDRMKDAEGRAEKAERERDDLRQEYHELFELNRRNFADLLAGQAREQELRLALNEMLRGVERGQLTSAERDGRAALARPSDTSALREFGLKVARAMYVCPGQEPLQKRDEAIVDAVLGAPTALK